MKDSQNGRDTVPRLRPVHLCAYEDEIEQLRTQAIERIEVDKKLDERLTGIEQKLGSLTWKLAVVAAAVQAATQIIEFFKG